MPEESACTAPEVTSQLPKEDVRVTRIHEIYAILNSWCLSKIRELAFIEKDSQDFVQEVIQNLFRRKGLDNYDPAKCQSFEALIRYCAHTHYVDKLRAKVAAKSRISPETGRPYSYASLEAALPVPGDDGNFSLSDVVPAEETTHMTIMEMADRCPDVQISPSYHMSWRQLFLWTVKHTADEIAEHLKISVSRVSQLQREMRLKYLQAPVEEPKPAKKRMVRQIRLVHPTPVAMEPKPVKAVGPVLSDHDRMHGVSA